MNRTLVFDMDGTIANLYGVDNWLLKLRTKDYTPYAEATPLYKMDVLNELLEALRRCGWRIAVTSWSCKGGTTEDNRLIKKLKVEWLKKNDFPCDEIHVVKYGTPKTNCTRHLGGFQILIDDNSKVRESWTLGDTIDAEKNILVDLANLLNEELKDWIK